MHRSLSALLSSCFFLLALAGSADWSLTPTSAFAQECWTGRVIKRGRDKQISDATPILQRPNRTGHFYGNTVRRIYYRGEVLPRPRDYYNSARAFVNRR